MFAFKIIHFPLLYDYVSLVALYAIISLDLFSLHSKYGAHAFIPEKNRKYTSSIRWKEKCLHIYTRHVLFKHW